MSTDLNNSNNAENRLTENDILKERKRRIFSLRTLVFLILAVIIICLLVSGIDVKETAEALGSADISMALLSVFFYLCSNFFKSLRFSVMLRDSGISVPRMFAISSYQNFFNQIMPARTGELTFLYYTKRMADVKISVSLHALLVTRLLDLVVVSLFFAVCLLLLFGTGSSPMLVAAAVLLGLFSVLCAFKMAWFVTAGQRLFAACAALFGLSNKPAIKKISGRIDSIAKDFSDIKLKSKMPLLTLTSLAVWICLYIFSYTTIITFGSNLSLIKSVVGSTGAVLTNVLPINSFGSFGTMEAGWTGGFMFVGMSMQEAVTTGFGYHLINFFAAALIAAICFAAVSFAKRLGRFKQPVQ